jgi:3-(3-hydroxy-phenyl)propionate hydroxylase
VRDAAGRAGWLLSHTGQGFVLLCFGQPGAIETAAIGALQHGRIAVHPLWLLPAGEQGPAGHAWLQDIEGLAARRCDARPGTAYLLRPDQHVAARWRHFDAAAVRAALARATHTSTP